MMQYRQLHYFVSVVEAGSFSRAASAIHVAQPALSQQIAQLEEQLGVSLLLRSSRGVRPTAAGDVFYREASSILRRLQQLPGIARSGARTTKGIVRLGMSSTFLTSAPMAFMEQCKGSLPDVILKMAISDSPTIKRRVTEQELDLGLVLEDEFALTFARTPLFRQQLFLIRHRAASRGKPVQLAELASLPLVLPPLPEHDANRARSSFRGRKSLAECRHGSRRCREHYYRGAGRHRRLGPAEGRSLRHVG
jgi:LysR family nitrogen assimilation transcriptional regulator